METNPGILFVDKTENPDVEIIIAPNNPDGRDTVDIESNASFIIYDFAYNSKIFTDKPVFITPNPNITISVIGTMSKTLCAPGCRLGWSFTMGPQAKDIQKRSNDELDLLTCGGATSSWILAKKYLKWILEKPSRLLTHLKTNKELLQKNKQIFINNLPDHISVISPSDKQGAYLWLKSNIDKDNLSEWFLKKNIIVKNGEQFGVSNEHARVNTMGHPDIIINAVYKMKNIV
jgi:aspartate/methionine/tyrosine aminotransferase